MHTKDTAHKAILRLVERFEEQYPVYKSTSYNEALTRRDFIDPFFTALGWDMNNSQGHAEAYREVIHEDKLKISGGVKAPDYSFKLPGGKRLFFVEAKKPHIVVKDEIIPAYQVRRYGWSAKMPISIITDFEEFAVYDCTKKPLATDKASVARISYLTFRDYLKEFDFIYETFSKEKVLKGSFDKFVQSDTYKKGTTTVDKEFLKSLDEWRTYLATNISWNNKSLDEDEINFAVQQIIDRIIFLRIAEDRSVEQYGALKEAITSGDYYKNLFDLFRRADDKYNSGLFDFKKDKISQYLKIDNKIIKTILNDLYYPQSPYEFSVLSVEILGSAYEQFLGKQIRIDSAHRARIEEKPEVRKAGGVYYTPQYIVDYIVQNTIGKQVEDKTPDEVSKLKIVDPACGSGSFLLGAYQFLLDYHKTYYKNNPGKNKKNGPLTPDGHLSTAEKKRILLNNIYGVDIDVNAVEVTKLSLLLKCLEGETEASINHQIQMFHERVLPTLDENIKSGNSLVDTDYYDSQFDFGEDKKVKPFSWKKAFPEVFRQGGFDAVIGNPPYGATFHKTVEAYLIQKYPISKKFPDSYCFFIIKGKNVLKAHGRIGYIVPNTFCDLENCLDFREWFLIELQLESIFQTGWAFKDAIVDTLVFLSINEKSNLKSEINITIDSNTYRRAIKDFLSSDLKKIDYRNNNSLSDFLVKFQSFPILSRFAEVKAGVKLYEKGKGTPAQSEKITKDKPFTSKGIQAPRAGWLPLFRGGDVTRYSFLVPQEFIQYGPWLAAPRSPELFKGQKILMRRTDDQLRATLDLSNGICVNSCHVIKIIPAQSDFIQLKYLLGILNSKLVQKVFELSNPQMMGKVFSEIKVIYVERLPLKTIDKANPDEVNLESELIKHVDILLQLNKDLAKAKLDTTISLIKSKIVFSEEKINSIVYKLYELSEEEIKLVEGNA